MDLLGHPWHQTTVAKLEGGKRPIRVDEAVALADIFGVDLEQLVQLRRSPSDRVRLSLEAALFVAEQEVQAAKAQLESANERFRRAEAAKEGVRARLRELLEATDRSDQVEDQTAPDATQFKDGK
jgi:transcriptional regulator with XRE-family HTH domain